MVKEGAVIDIDALPLTPLLTRQLSEPLPEEADYKQFAHTGQRFPLCACSAMMGH